MKYFLDTEFIESGPAKPVQLISIGIVCEDGRELYAESCEFDPFECNDWVRDNVLPNLTGPAIYRTGIAHGIMLFVGEDKRPEFWGYYSDYDWVVFCQIFGTMMDLPNGFPMYCRDLKQWCDELGNPELPKQDSTEHHALNDARWNKKAFEFLKKMETPIVED